MDKFDKDILHSSEIVDTLFGALGDNTPRKRLLQIDYKENGADMNISAVVYQNVGLSDDKMIAELVISYVEQGKIISSIVEVNAKSQLVGVMYIAPEILKEYVKDKF